jgi:folate-binding protein YgfZ
MIISSPVAPDSGALLHLGLLRFAGSDAVAFLQGQVSNDTRRLGAGEPLLAAYSTPQGRVVAVLQILPHSSGLLALLPRELAPVTREGLRKYILRAKVQIEDQSEHLTVLGLHGSGALVSAALPVPDAARGYLERDGIGVARAAGAGLRYWVVGTAQALANHPLEHTAGDWTALLDDDAARLQRVERDWRLADIRAGVPQVYAATRELFVAQMLNLDLIDGISFTKGCFTGQEIIARTQHLGRIKRRLFRLRLPAGSWAVGQALELRDGRTGRLVEVAAIDDGVEALAVLGVDALGAEGADPDPADRGARVDATLLTLPYALTAAA